ncbi:MAG: DUF4037 domain-containing protein [Defluviitaleaceae bacterium]|nr:DUF4037 domain-containing protein [Defluviitaleaceae bacterium]
MYSDAFNKTIKLFSAQSQIDCIVLGGSKAVGNDDEYSDFDVYVYLNAPLSIETRKALLSETCSFIEMNNTFWETEDNCILNDGAKIEMIYCDIPSTRQQMHSILVDGTAGLGFTTCTCFRVLESKILHDPQGLYRDLVSEFSMPYPEHLRQNIIQKNWALLETSQQSFRLQIEKAIKRDDIVLVTRRIVGFMNSYFDIIFALNRVYVTGEKKLDQLTIKMCKQLPRNFQENLEKLLTLPKAEIMPVVSDMVDALKFMIRLYGMPKTFTDDELSLRAFTQT